MLYLEKQNLQELTPLLIVCLIYTVATTKQAVHVCVVWQDSTAAILRKPSVMPWWCERVVGKGGTAVSNPHWHSYSVML